MRVVQSQAGQPVARAPEFTLDGLQESVRNWVLEMVPSVVENPLQVARFKSDLAARHRLASQTPELLREAATELGVSSAEAQRRLLERTVSIENQAGQRELCFNLPHSRDVALKLSQSRLEEHLATVFAPREVVAMGNLGFVIDRNGEQGPLFVNHSILPHGVLLVTIHRGPRA